MQTKKIKFIFLFVVFFSLSLRGQNSVQVVVNVLPPYQVNIADYQMHPDKIVIKLINTESFDLNVQLGASLSSDNGVLVKTKEGFRSNQPIRIGANSSVDVEVNQIIQLFDISNLEISGTDRVQFERTGILPEGDYQLCVRAYNFRTLDPYSSAQPSGCSGLIPLYHIEAPIILNPISESTVKAQDIQNLIINWTTPAGAPPELIYTLKMVEVQGNRNPMDALLSNTQIPFFEQSYTQNSMLYGPAEPQLIKGKKYALMVNAKDPTGNTVFRNNGNSVINWFKYDEAFAQNDSSEQGDNDIKVKKNNDDQTPPQQPLAEGNCGNQCKSIPPKGNNYNNNIKVGDKIKIAGFEMEIAEISNRANGKISGTGTLAVPFINSSLAKLKVEFLQAEINDKNQMMSGYARALVKQGSPNLVPAGQDQAASTLNHSVSDIKNILSFISNNPSQSIANAAGNIGLELPLGISGSPFLLAITEATFTPEQAFFSMATAVEIPETGESFALSGRNICMSDADNICGNMELYLASDFDISLLRLKLLGQKKEGNKMTGTFMKLSQKAGNKIEIEQFNVKASYTFPDKSLIDAQTRQTLAALLEFDAKKGWSNWTAQFTLPEFYLDGLEQVKFNLAGKSAFWDHSDFENPAGIPAPYQSTDPNEPDIRTDLPDWRGVYFPNITVTLPAIIKNANNPNNSLTFQAQKLIFNSSGFTGSVEANNLISLGDGSLSGWYASVDNIKLDFWKSSFKQSQLTGRLVLPPSGSEINNPVNQLNYKCLLNNAQDNSLNFQFSVTPKNNLLFKALFAQVNINNSSYILVEKNMNDFSARAKLDGSMGIDDKLGKIPGIVNVSLPQLQFQNFCITTNAPYIGNGAVFRFNSPQKTVAGFSMTFRSTSFTIAGGNPTLDFEGNLNLLEDGDAPFSLAAQTHFSLSAKISLGGNGRVVWDGIGAKLKDISFGADADLGAFKLKGLLKYYNKENPANCGFVGILAITLPSFGGKIGMKTQFGTWGREASAFKYFSFEALLDFGDVGIPLFPGTALYGFGGGVFYNMAVPKNQPGVNTLQTKAEQKNNTSGEDSRTALELLSYSPTGQILTPQRGTFSVAATVLFGLTSRNTLDADVTLTLSFNSNGGVKDFTLDGNVRLVTDASAPLPERTEKSLVQGNLKVGYDFENEIFDLNIQVTLKFPPGDGGLITAWGGFHYNISPAGWYLHIGRPQTPCGIKLLSLFEGKTYLEAGSYNIDPMPPIPREIRDLAGPEANNFPVVNSVPRGTTTAGFIHGAYSYFHVGGQFLFLYGYLKAGMGYDIAFKKYENFSCQGIQHAGANGWYATGQAYLGVNLKVGMDFGFLFGKIDIFEGGAVAAIQAGLPNPSWAKGTVAGYFSILGGIFSGSFNLQFELGSKCVPVNNSGLDFTLISEATPGDQKKTIEDIEITELPNVAFNFSLYKGFFQYKQTDDEGKSKTRYFQFDKSTVEIRLVGGGEVYDNNRFVIDNKENTLVLRTDKYLKPETDYQFIIKAWVNEASSENGAYKHVLKPDGKPYTEERIYKFRTNRGLKTIPNNILVYSYPLHSDRAYIDDEAGGPEYYLQIAKQLDQNYFDVPDKEAAKIFATVYKNDSKEASYPVTIKNYQWTFPKFALSPDADYRIEFNIYKPAAVSNSSAVRNVEVNKLNVIRAVQTQGATARIYKNIGLNVSYLHFKTSIYKSFQEKREAAEIISLTLIDASQRRSATLSRNNSIATNKALLDSLHIVEIDKQKNLINIRPYFYHLDLHIPEIFSAADTTIFTSAQLFFNRISAADKSMCNCGKEPFKPLFEGDESYAPLTLLPFIAETTGLPADRLTFSIAKINPGALYKVNFYGGYTYFKASRIGETISAPYTPESEPISDNFSITMRFNNAHAAVQNTNLIYDAGSIRVPLNAMPDFGFSFGLHLAADNFNDLDIVTNWGNFDSGVKSLAQKGGLNNKTMNNLGQINFKI